jgi:small-conductance mechanosensitive channel
MPFQVSYDSPLELAMQLITNIVKEHARIMVTPEPTVQIKGFGESGIDLMLTVWIPDPEEGSAALQSELYLEIWQAFKAHQIVIPYPQREVRILNASETPKVEEAAVEDTSFKKSRTRKPVSKT